MPYGIIQSIPILRLVATGDEIHRSPGIGCFSPIDGPLNGAILKNSLAQQVQSAVARCAEEVGTGK